MPTHAWSCPRVLCALLLASLALALGACSPRPSLPDGPGVVTGEPSAPPDACAGNTHFHIGSGVYAITGPAAEVGMMGYARLDQQTAGRHLRLRARAFVIATPCNGKRLAFVSADLGALFQVIKQQVVRRLQSTYGTTYTEANVILSATHTHSGPGGLSHDALYNLTTLGFHQHNLEIVVEGLYQAIVRAHNHRPYE